MLDVERGPGASSRWVQEDVLPGDRQSEGDLGRGRSSGVGQIYVRYPQDLPPAVERRRATGGWSASSTTSSTRRRFVHTPEGPVKRCRTCASRLNGGTLLHPDVRQRRGRGHAPPRRAAGRARSSGVEVIGRRGERGRGQRVRLTYYRGGGAPGLRPGGVVHRAGRGGAAGWEPGVLPRSAVQQEPLRPGLRPGGDLLQRVRPRRAPSGVRQPGRCPGDDALVRRLPAAGRADGRAGLAEAKGLGNGCRPESAVLRGGRE